MLTDHGLEPDRDKIDAVLEMLTPQNVEDAQRPNGFVTCLSKFLPKLADVMEPVRRLTRKDAEWNWSEDQESALRKVKNLATDAPIVGRDLASRARVNIEEAPSKPLINSNE